MIVSGAELFSSFFMAHKNDPFHTSAGTASHGMYSSIGMPVLDKKKRTPLIGPDMKVMQAMPAKPMMPKAPDMTGVRTAARNLTSTLRSQGAAIRTSVQDKAAQLRREAAGLRERAAVMRGSAQASAADLRRKADELRKRRQARR